MESVANAMAGATAGVISMLVLYPLDNVRTRMQIHAKRIKAPKASNLMSPQRGTTAEATTYNDPLSESEYESMSACMKAIIKREGWNGLYNGLSSALFGITVSNAVYFFWYHNFKRFILERSGRFVEFKKQSITPWENMGVAMLAGAVNVCFTLPIWVINAQMKVSTKLSLTQRVQKLWQQGGIPAFYRGFIPSLILVSNPAVQFVSYEQLSRLYFLLRRARARRAGLGDLKTIHLSPIEQFFLAAIAKTIATLFTYPYQVVKERLLVKSKAYNYNGSWDAATTIYKEEGLTALFRGLRAKLSQTVINAAFLFMVYERLLLAMRVFLKGKSP